MTSTRGNRQLAIATAIVFVISSIFPVAAGLSGNPESFSRWWGMLDVVIAFILAALAIVIAVRFERGVTVEINLAAYRTYRVLINAILVFSCRFLSGRGSRQMDYFSVRIGVAGMVALLCPTGVDRSTQGKSSGSISRQAR